SAIAVAPTAPSVIYVGTGDGNVQVTQNTGGSWSNVTKAPLPNRFVSDIAVVHGSPQTAYVVYNGFDEHTPSTRGHVFKTTNYGSSWQNISSNLPNIPVLSIALDRDAPGTIYIGTDIGVFRSRNDGVSWELFNNGMANVAVVDLALNPDTDVLLAATHGRSVYRLNLGAAPKLQLVHMPLSLKNFRSVIGTRTPTVRPTATATPVFSLPTATATRSVRPTATQPPPTPAGAVVTFIDDFSNSYSGWGGGWSGQCWYGYENGEYRISVTAYSWACWAAAPSAAHPDGIFQVKARGSAGAIPGLIFGATNDLSAFYAFFVDPGAGEYALLLYYGDSWYELRSWTYSSAIALGGGVNELRVARSGATIALY
ncbi:MAG: hypothetical protein H5T63_08200, partial [Chloroflexi bacterium]|nr:hypothetical protein [Chloroflexota bacterium]